MQIEAKEIFKFLNNPSQYLSAPTVIGCFRSVADKSDEETLGYERVFWITDSQRLDVQPGSLFLFFNISRDSPNQCVIDSEEQIL